MSIEVPPLRIEVPGRGMVEVAAMRVDAAVQEYDSRLRFGFNPTNSDWVVYIQYPRDFEGAPYMIDGTPVMPVLGVGKDIPAPHTVVSRLQEMDGWKRQADFHKQHVANFERAKKEREDRKYEESQEVAERIEHVMRANGHDTGVTKIFFGSKRRTRSGSRYNIGRRER